MDHEECRTRVGDEIARLAEVTADADLETPVPTCPGWSMARLVKHVGIVHRWATAVVATRATGAVSQRDLDVGLPQDVAGYPAWLAAGAAPLLAALRDAGADAPVWSWGAGAGGEWWARRMLHETAVHRADAEAQPRPRARLRPGGRGGRRG